ncbi:MAG: hypothetical protein MMC23_009219 [Stictis urceolatum]|nr:hypothetical protein [Stictis urceolata]
MLSEAVNLACDATAVALHVGKVPLFALSLLEKGRGLLADSLEEVRMDILDLRENHSDLADQFVRLRGELEQSVTRDTSLMSETRQPLPKAQVDRRLAIDKGLDELIDKIRKQSGFEDFLLPPSGEEMQAAARCGPVVVINVSEYRCDALLVEQHQIRSLALPKANSKEIKEKARIRGLGSPRILAWLWDAFASPILDALGYTQPPPDIKWPHIWWTPTGLLGKFPLHAAGRHSEGSNKAVLDRVMSSYSSSIKAIIHGHRRRVRESTSKHPAQALLVAMQNTPEHARLDFAVKEVKLVQKLCTSMSIDTIEPGRRKQDITTCLPNCEIFHFAGHGHTDDDDPSQSYLLLEDWKSDKLTVATLLEMNLRKHSPFLAYLSACGTGEIRDERFFDESIQLISACQLAGFRHVIGTLWEVNDECCVDIAKITYEELREGAMTDESVCLSLHKATRELRDRWLREPTKYRHGSKSIRNAYISSTDNEIGDGATDDRDQSSARLPRKITLCDSDKEDDRPLHWVPYVHFGF